jgi:hypothetical protein
VPIFIGGVAPDGRKFEPVFEALGRWKKVIREAEPRRPPEP